MSVDVFAEVNMSHFTIFCNRAPLLHGRVMCLRDLIGLGKCSKHMEHFRFNTTCMERPLWLLIFTLTSSNVCISALIWNLKWQSLRIAIANWMRQSPVKSIGDNLSKVLEWMYWCFPSFLVWVYTQRGEVQETRPNTPLNGS